MTQTERIEKTVSLAEAQAQLHELVQSALRGEEVIIRENGHAVKLTPLPQEAPLSQTSQSDEAPKQEALTADELPKRRPKAGSMPGLIIYMADDFDAPLEDFKEYME